ncbi:uncharacterized protein LOC123534343 isoform X3 [Mercenaria mercenaria]|nr:uncharacterized protein LOC123534343 isoform X3 [Mercenaria mercenaria]XP_045172497.2 uncharacterized protein LOC123534343 isoform X3 [Mercenaria mercenaria]
MPPEGYSSVSTAAETDFNGIISVVINYKEFQTKVSEDLSNNANIFCKLSKDTWTITDKDISKHLQNATDEAKESIDKTKLKLLEGAKRFIEANTKQDITKVLTQLQHMFSKYKDEIEVAVRHGIKRIRRESEPSTIYKRLRSETEEDYHLQTEELRHRLVQTYKSKCSTLPISPLLEEEELPLLTFFVKPYMRRLEHHKIQKEEISVDSYRNLFY